MGRRPNQLILEYFERGPKLEDASNRYQHTCKSCGEKVHNPHDAKSLTVDCIQLLTQPSSPRAA